MTLLVPTHVVHQLEMGRTTSYQRKLPATGLDYERLRKAETRRRLRALRRNAGR